MPGFLFFGYAAFFGILLVYLLRLVVMGRRLSRDRAALSSLPTRNVSSRVERGPRRAGEKTRSRRQAGDGPRPG